VFIFIVNRSTLTKLYYRWYSPACFLP